MEDDRRNGILMSPLLLVAETKIKKNFQKIFKSKSLDIITKRKVKIANYIDVMLNLKDKSQSPYKKPNEKTKFLYM